MNKGAKINISFLATVFFILAGGICLLDVLGKETYIWEMFYLIYCGLLLLSFPFMVRNLMVMGGSNIIETLLGDKGLEPILSSLHQARYYTIKFFLNAGLIIYMGLVMKNIYLFGAAIIFFIYTRVLYLGCKNLIIDYLIKTHPDDPLFSHESEEK